MAEKPQQSDPVWIDRSGGWESKSHSDVADANAIAAKRDYSQGMVSAGLAAAIATPIWLEDGSESGFSDALG